MKTKIYATIAGCLLAFSTLAGAQLIDEDGPMRDAMEYASDNGVDVNEALSRLEMQGIIGDLEPLLRLEEEAVFAGMWIEHQPKFRLQIRVTEPQSVGRLQSQFAKTDLRNIVRVKLARVTLAQLEASQSAAGFLARQLGIPADTGINVGQNQVELFVLDASAFQAALDARGLTLPEHTELVEVDDLSVVEADIFGGLPISTCTIGFSVKNSSGTKGVITAAHCSNTQSYDGTNLPYQSGAYYNQYDVQWHTAPGFTVVNKIRSSCSSCTRSITSTRSRSNQSVGSYVCKQGKVTGYTCGYITDTSYQSNSPSSATATYIRVSRDGVDLSSPGDSGGPWFNANTAYGVHHSGIGDDATYMAINYVSILGVSVLTN